MVGPRTPAPWEMLPDAVVRLQLPPKLKSMLASARMNADSGDWFGAAGAASERRQASLPHLFKEFYEELDEFIRSQQGFESLRAVRGKVGLFYDANRPDDLGGHFMDSTGVGWTHIEMPLANASLSSPL